MPRAGIRAPSPAERRITYKNTVQYRKNTNQLRLCAPPANQGSALVLKNVGIVGIKGREDIFAIGDRLFVKNTKSTGTVNWYDGGQAPIF